MNKLFTFLGSAMLLGLTSCNNQHEVVPPPLPVASLECECTADIDGVAYEYIDTCSYDNEKTINTTGTSRGIYSSEIQNEAMNQGFELEMRTVEWFDDGSNLPTTEEWKAYFENNMSPSYYINDNNSSNGVVIKWTDPNGDLWQSDTTLDCSGIDFLYTTMEHDSDQTGNYMKFKSVFNCPLIKFDNSDTVCVENGVMKTSFRRE
jgi:hypothetical protein